MSVSICTWNINSVRLREGIVLQLLREENPDVLCLQELKSPEEKVPLDGFRALGYEHFAIHGQKGYNGVGIISKLPLSDVNKRDFCAKGDARHIAATLPNGVRIHNYYIPAGGDVPDRVVNEKFGHKIDFIGEMQAWFESETPEKSVLVGDLNIAPREDDVWSHKQLLKVVSHTPIEVETLTKMQNSGGWMDVTRKDIPEGKVYSWWSYRARDWDAADKGRRLDHIWSTPDIIGKFGGSRIARHVRGWEKPSDHAPVFAELSL